MKPEIYKNLNEWLYSRKRKEGPKKRWLDNGTAVVMIGVREWKNKGADRAKKRSDEQKPKTHLNLMKKNKWFCRSLNGYFFRH